MEENGTTDYKRKRCAPEGHNPKLKKKIWGSQVYVLGRPKTGGTSMGNYGTRRIRRRDVGRGG